jgi:hypothetical protein
MDAVARLTAAVATEPELTITSGRERDRLRDDLLSLLQAAARPANIDADIAAVAPAELLQAPQQSLQPRQVLWIALAARQENLDAACRLLCPRGRVATLRHRRAT